MDDNRKQTMFVISHVNLLVVSFVKKIFLCSYIYNIENYWYFAKQPISIPIAVCFFPDYNNFFYNYKIFT